MSKEIKNHEVLKAEVVNAASVEVTVEDVINREIKRFDTTKEKLNEMALGFKELASKEIENKEEYKKVYEAHQDSKSIIASVRSKSKQIKEDYESVKKGVTKYENELLGIMLPAERDLNETRKRWEALEEERKNAEKIEKERLLNERVEKVKESGAMFDGQMYVCGLVSITIKDIEGLNEERFSSLLESIAEEKRQLDEYNRKREEEEAKRLEAERLEAERLEAERLKQEAENKAMKEQIAQMRTMMLEAHGLVKEQVNFTYKDVIICKVDELNELSDVDFLSLNQSVISRKKEIDEAIANEVIAFKRTEKLLELGFISTGLEFVKSFKTLNSIVFKKSDLLDTEEEHFESYVSNVSEAISTDEKRNDNYSKNFEVVQNLGFVFNSKENIFRYVNDFEDLKLTLEEVVNNYDLLSDEQVGKYTKEIAVIKAKVEKAIKEKISLEAKIEKERAAKEEKERVSKLSDSEKYNEYLIKLKAVEVPDLVTSEFKDRVKNILNILN